MRPSTESEPHRDLSGNSRVARLVELRYFGGLTGDEVAAALGLSAETVRRDWKVARLWLRHELRRRAIDTQP